MLDRTTEKMVGDSGGARLGQSTRLFGSSSNAGPVLTPESARIVIREATLSGAPLTSVPILASLKLTLENVETNVPPVKLIAVAPAVRAPEKIMLEIEMSPLQFPQDIVAIETPQRPALTVLLVSVIEPAPPGSMNIPAPFDPAMITVEETNRLTAPPCPATLFSHKPLPVVFVPTSTLAPIVIPVEA